MEVINMKYVVDMRKVLAMRPDLDFISARKLSMEELSDLESKYDMTNQENDDVDESNYDKYRKLYLLFNELNHYVPEEVIFNALKKVGESFIWDKKTVYSRLDNYHNYYLIKDKTVNGEICYEILVPFYKQSERCNPSVFKQIIYYYYPLLRNFELDFYKVESIFDSFNLRFEDNNGSLNIVRVSLLDIILGDVEAILNNNTVDVADMTDSNVINNYKKRYEKMYGSEEFKFLIDILLNRRNPDSVLLTRGGEK